MSYCVNCGVELDKSAKKCVLCDTPVYNPKEEVTEKEAVETPFSDTPLIISEKVKQKFIAIVISFIIIIPNIVCTFVNLFFYPDTLWFIYIMATSYFCWILFVFPFLTNKIRPYLLWAFDTVSVILYVFVFYAQMSRGEMWFFHLALPIILITAFCVLYFIRWIRQRKRHWTSKFLHILIDLVIVLSVSTLCLFLGEYTVKAEICAIADMCCLALVAFGVYANKSKKVRAWLAKRLFV